MATVAKIGPIAAPSAPPEEAETVPKAEDSPTSQAELKRLRNENRILVDALRALRRTHPTLAKAAAAASAGPSAPPDPSEAAMLGTPSAQKAHAAEGESPSDCGPADAPPTKSLEHETPSALQPQELFKAVELIIHSDRFIDAMTRAEERADAVFIAGDEENEIGVIDPGKVGWWTLVPSNPEDPDSVVEEDVAEPLDGPYVLVSETDVADAVADFVASCVIRLPEAKQLSKEQLQQHVGLAFEEFREKSTFQQLRSWTSFATSAWSYGATAYRIYTDPMIARMTLQAFFTVSKWLALLII